MDEHTPHIHATLVPIVTGAQEGGQKKPKEGGRTYRKKANTARLCADDVLNRTRLLAYHDICQGHGEIRPATRGKKVRKPGMSPPPSITAI